MSELALRVEGLSKRYRLGAGVAGRYRYGRLTETLSNAFRGSIARKAVNEKERFIWALKDVSFEVKEGEVLGIIGRNGAGKTTLLKILSRITHPTEGRMEVNGRVGALLEVGTGFHPELTGKENVFLNGAILGMRKAEIERKFDEIVDFADVERFLDTPVKRYSSGMYVRLAFAVAAHMEPEILIVDEVLAVGDANFQKKCLGRMAEVGSSGRTVLFVSHNTQAVLRLCQRVILLDQGAVLDDGNPRSVVSEYLNAGLGSAASREWMNPDEAPGDDVVRLKSVTIRNESGVVSEEMSIADPLTVEVEYWHLSHDPTCRPSSNLHFFNGDGITLFVTCDFNNRGWWAETRKPGIVKSVCRIPSNFLAEGRILVDAVVSTFNPTVVHAMERGAIEFQVVDRTSGEGVRGEFANEWPGVVRPMLEWHVDYQADDTSMLPRAYR